MTYSLEIHIINDVSIIFIPNVIGLHFFDDCITVYTMDRKYYKYMIKDIKKIITEVNNE